MKTIRIVGDMNYLSSEFYYLSKELDQKEEYELIIQKPKKKRSLSQNAIYWDLLNQYAKWADQSAAVLHNDLLAHYGVATDIFVTVPMDREIEKMTDLHLKRTSKIVRNKKGKRFILCQLLKGSHQLTKYEMSKLITGLINEIIGSGADKEIDIKIDDNYIMAEGQDEKENTKKKSEKVSNKANATKA